MVIDWHMLFSMPLVGCAFFGRLNGYGKLASLAWSKIRRQINDKR